VPVASLTATFARTRHIPYRNELLALAVLCVGMLFLTPRAPFGIALLGVVGGAAALIHALGIILIYRTGRFINFAQIQIGLTGATLFSSLIYGRRLLDGVDRVCGCVGEDPSSFWYYTNYVVAVLLALALSVLAALATYQLVVRRFANQPKLVLTIATIFVAQLLSYAGTKLSGDWLVPDYRREALGVKGAAAVALPWKVNIRIGPANFQLDSILLVATAVLAVVGITLYLRLSPTGTAIRASAESPSRARTLGINVESVTSRIWLISGLLSGVAALIFVTTNSVNTDPEAADVGVGQVIPVSTLVLVLAIAVVARFTSLYMAGLAAIVIGVLQQAMNWAFSSSAPLEIALVFIIGGLLLVQSEVRGRADRDDTSGWEAVKEIRPIPPQLRSLPAVRKWSRVTAVVCALAVLGLPWTLAPSKTALASSFLIYMIAAESLLVLTGWSGQLSLGTFGFGAIGAWIAAASGLPFFIALTAAGVGGAAAALLIGVPALKLRGLNLAITSLAFSLSASALFLGDGPLGRRLPDSLPRPSLVGMSLDDERTFYYFCLGAIALTILGIVGLRRSRTGRVLIALRDNDAAVESYGVNLLRARLTAFGIAGFLAAIAGALLAYDINGAVAAAYAPEVSIVLFVYVVIGGLGSPIGPVLGCTFLAILTFSSSSESLRELAGGGVGLLLLASLPGGLAQGVADLRDAMLRRLAARHRIMVPTLMADQRAASFDSRAPIVENVLSSSQGAVFVPTVYEPAGQWALARYGAEDITVERVGG
jgi:branched-chain amino acid transport system permease protein